MFKFFLGPMSKNIVDAILDFNSDNSNKIAFIPSRRQIEFSGGYVNKWTTEEFRKYVGDSFICRDHGGPLQGHSEDDGFDSLKVDCEYMNMIHVDPWKKFKSLDEGIEQTVKIIDYCFNINSKLLFEVGTEESIRKFSSEEIHKILQGLETKLKSNQFDRIKYCVIQSGTSLKENINTGFYDKKRLQNMVKVVKSFNLLSKEHNGDYLPTKLIKEKFSLGLDSINIAPELGQIETKTYLDMIKHNRPDLLTSYWKICYDSKRWVKWVDKTFDPITKKEELINICGHYVLSNEEFIKIIKKQLPGVEKDIKYNIRKKLKNLNE